MTRLKLQGWMLEPLPGSCLSKASCGKGYGAQGHDIEVEIVVGGYRCNKHFPEWQEETETTTLLGAKASHTLAEKRISNVPVSKNPGLPI